MSQRSIRRATARREAAERRRDELRRRRAGLIAGAVIGASMLAVVPAEARAETLTVTTTADRPANASPDACATECTLRDAIELADDGDVIAFASGVTGAITLREGELAIADDITIDGPGATVLSLLGRDDGDGVVGSGDSRIMSIRDADVEISGLTLSRGGGGGGAGGAVFVGEEDQLRLVESTLTGNVAAGDGGAISVYGGDLELVRSTVSGNRASSTGGGVSGMPAEDGKYDRVPNITITDSTVTGNTATANGGGVLSTGGLRVRRSTISDNTSTGASGGGVAQLAIRSLDISDSVVSGNKALEGAGGGIALGRRPMSKYGSPDTGEVRDTTIARNQAGEGGGLAVGSVGGISLSIVGSTVADNTATDAGGGLLVQPDGDSGADLDGSLELVQSTVSGNAADTGGGISVGDEDSSAAASEGIELTGSTVAANRAATRGGGVYLSAYGADAEPARGGPPPETATTTIVSRSTLLGDNTAAGAPQDLDSADGSSGGGLDVAFTLIEARGDTPLLGAAGAANVIGVDPQLGGLADNGGQTATHLPALSSPAIDRGAASAETTVDQRGRDRTVDLPAENARGGDGTDIGAVEVERPADPPPTPPAQPPATNVTIIQQQPAIFTRVRALRLTARVTPGSDTNNPRTFRTTGRLILPPGLSTQDGCTSFGLVAVRVAVGNRTISTRRVQLQPDCTYRASVTFRVPARFGKRKRLLFTPRFLGNQRVFPISTRPGRRVTVRR